MNAPLPDPAEERWHIDRRIPVTLIAAFLIGIVAQSFALGIWITTLSNRIGNLETFAAAQGPASLNRETRITILETNYRNFGDQLSGVARKLDALIEMRRQDLDSERP